MSSSNLPVAAVGVPPNAPPSLRKHLRAPPPVAAGASPAASLRHVFCFADSIISQNFGFSCKAWSSPVGRLDRNRKSFSVLRLRMR